VLLDEHLAFVACDEDVRAERGEPATETRMRFSVSAACQVELEGLSEPIRLVSIA